MKLDIQLFGGRGASSNKKKSKKKKNNKGLTKKWQKQYEREFKDGYLPF